MIQVGITSISKNQGAENKNNDTASSLKIVAKGKTNAISKDTSASTDKVGEKKEIRMSTWKRRGGET